MQRNITTELVLTSPVIFKYFISADKL